MLHFLDGATAPVTALARLKLASELTGLLRKKADLPGGPTGAIQGIRIAADIIRVLRELGQNPGKEQDQALRKDKAFELEGGPEPVAQPRQVTAKFFDFDPNRKTSERRRDNGAAMELLRKIDRGEVDGAELTDAQKATLARYSGTGGNLVGADGKKGSAYEYYTPKPIAQGMWSLLAEMGFKGGKTLDPCSGVGIFGACAPESVAMESVELNETSGRINQMVNGGPGYNAIVSPFEAVASRTPDESYDAVVSNVPFGSMHDRGSNRKMDERYQEETLEAYFILRSLEKLKPGGIAAFIVPPRVVSAKGGREEKLRIALSYMSEFMGAYRLPNSVFGTADADTITDVIVLRKYGREALDKIAELREQNPSLLVKANVQWTEFIGGNYFAGEGRRYVLGEFQAKDPNKFRDVDRVINNNSVADIAKLMRKFPGSRVDWALLDATETQPIVYNEGDTITMAGQTLEMRDGRWVAVGKASEDSRFDGMGQVLSTPTIAAVNKVSWAQASEYADYLERRSMALDMPDWLRLARVDLLKMPEADRASMWQALLIGLAVVEVTQAHGSEVGFNYDEAYPALSEGMRDVAATAKRGFAQFGPISKAALRKVGILYSRKDGLSVVWTGDVAADVMAGVELSEEAQIDAIKYTSQGIHIPVEDLKRVYGEAFDPLADDDWCLSGDGKTATKADDYYTGNLGDFLARIDEQIAQADDPLRSKLLRQKAAARDRVDVVDPMAMRFNMFSPLVTLEERAEFLRRFFHPAFVVGYDKDGEKVILCDIAAPKNENERQLKRLAEYVNSKVVSTRTSGADALASPELEEQRRAMLRDMIARANAQMDQWVKANPVIIGRLRAIANDPSRIYFTEVDDYSPIKIDGMSEAVDPATGAKRVLHGYQNAFVRKMGRRFGGINGDGVGLGKTIQALAAAQYVQSIGVKKRTMFVVPNSTLSNWRREAGMAYASMDDCLFIGLDVDEDTGTAKVTSGNYARDFTMILANKHRKIFCTSEAFKAIPLKDSTVQAYESYLGSVDPSFEGGDRKADSERADSKLAETTEGTGQKSNAIPFFEDMGIDSLVFDELHSAKNSKTLVEFGSAKFLSVAPASQRGLDAQIKAWYVRSLSPLKDGVLGLTATPVTNSPLEIYAMLSLAVGEEQVHNMFMGVRGADAFMETMCDIGEEDEEGIDGVVRTYRVFRGLQNVKLLRQAMGAVTTIRTAEQVKLGDDAMRIPDGRPQQTAVQLPQQTREMLGDYIKAYRAAREMLKGPNGHVEPEELEAMERVASKFGEPVELIAHPFNLIRKMTAVIADPELDQLATFYTVTDRATAEQVIERFNKLAREEVRRAPGPWTDAGAVIGPKVVKDGEAQVTMLRIKVQAAINKEGRVVIDTTNTNLQREFEAMAERAGLDLDVTVPPKLAAMLENIQKEEAHPRSSSGKVKQLIFCDILGLHNKIRRLISKRVGIPMSAIAVASGQTITDPEQMQEVQDGFNADGESNKYRYVVANEKAEVGINLQKGTQAIHHLTIGWTPDSTIQRDGRGVRQGNTTQFVNVYHYDADGTFDRYKRKLTSKKADWIGQVMDRQGENDVAVAGGLTRQQYEDLIEATGDERAMEAVQAKAEQRERDQRTQAARMRQAVNLRTAMAQNKFMTEHQTARSWVVKAAMELYDRRIKLAAMEQRADGKGIKADALAKITVRIEEERAKISELITKIDASATFQGDFHKHKHLAVPLGNIGIERMLQAVPGYKVAHKNREEMETILSGKYAVAVKEGGPLQEDWQQEVDQARELKEQALRDFERIASGPDSPYPVGFVQAFRDGKLKFVDGQPLAPGLFVRGPEGLMVVSMDSIAGKALRFFPTMASAELREVVGKPDLYRIIMFGTPEYEAAMAEAAALDDQATGVDSTNRHMLFSEQVPAVSRYRKNPTTVAYNWATVRLPAPGHPYPLFVADDASDAMKALASQTPVQGWNGHQVLLDSKVEASVDPAAGTANAAEAAKKRLLALLEKTVTSKTALTLADYTHAAWGPYGMRDRYDGTVKMWIAEFARSRAPWPDLNEAIETAEDSEAISSMARDAVIQAYSTFLVLPEDFKTNEWLTNYGIRGAMNSRLYALQRAQDAKKAAEEAERRRAEEAAKPVPEPEAAAVVEAAATAEAVRQAVIRLSPWTKESTGEQRIYINGIGWLNRDQRVYAYQTETGDWGLMFSRKEFTPDQKARVSALVEADILAMNQGQPVKSFKDLWALGAVKVPSTDPAVSPGVTRLGISGNTKANKDLIKAAAAAVGGAARWDGDRVRWIVPAAAWDHLKTNNPEAAQQLQAEPV